MKKLLLLLLCVPLIGLGKSECSNHENTIFSDSVNQKIDQMPLLGDCEDEICTQLLIMKHILENIKYPDAALANFIEGRVIVEFIVEKDGEVGRIKLLKGLNLGLFLNLSKKEKREFRKRVNLKKDEVQIYIDNLNNGINNEAIRVVRSLPKFIPGKNFGEAVPVKYAVPIRFSLPFHIYK